ncbi:hypothetical protein WJX74_005792 [Apatococcus lobatus]|uniref:Uncharacterized protein n=1 Tax=Apatococcus lobatus TaxID=904363 RepID=A0AAW1QH95_9CHLO
MSWTEERILAHRHNRTDRLASLLLPGCGPAAFDIRQACASLADLINPLPSGSAPKVCESPQPQLSAQQQQQQPLLRTKENVGLHGALEAAPQESQGLQLTGKQSDKLVQGLGGAGHACHRTSKLVPPMGTDKTLLVSDSTQQSARQHDQGSRRGCPERQGAAQSLSCQEPGKESSHETAAASIPDGVGLSLWGSPCSVESSKRKSQRSPTSAACLDRPEEARLKRDSAQQPQANEQGSKDAAQGCSRSFPYDISPKPARMHGKEIPPPDQPTQSTMHAGPDAAAAGLHTTDSNLGPEQTGQLGEHGLATQCRATSVSHEGDVCNAECPDAIHQQQQQQQASCPRRERSDALAAAQKPADKDSGQHAEVLDSHAGGLEHDGGECLSSRDNDGHTVSCNLGTAAQAAMRGGRQSKRHRAAPSRLGQGSEANWFRDKGHAVVPSQPHGSIAKGMAALTGKKRNLQVSWSKAWSPLDDANKLPDYLEGENGISLESQRFGFLRDAIQVKGWAGRRSPSP